MDMRSPRLRSLSAFAYSSPIPLNPISTTPLKCTPSPPNHPRLPRIRTVPIARLYPTTTTETATHVVTILSETAAASRDSLTTLVDSVIDDFSGEIYGVDTLGKGGVEVSLHLPPTTPLPALRTQLHLAGAPAGADLNLQRHSERSVAKRLAVFDLDSTLITCETVDELAAEAGCGAAVAAITRRAMEGGLDFRASLRERVALLRGLDAAALDAVVARAAFTPGAERLVDVLGKVGFETVIVSGGFEFLAGDVGERLGVDQWFANGLEVEDGRLTGKTVGEVVDGEFKARTLERIAEERGLKREQVMAVGDGSNDLAMMAKAGLSVAFNAKPIVQEKAAARVNQPSLSYVLYLLGLRDHEIDKLSG